MKDPASNPCSRLSPARLVAMVPLLATIAFSCLSIAGCGQSDEERFRQAAREHYGESPGFVPDFGPPSFLSSWFFRVLVVILVVGAYRGIWHLIPYSRSEVRRVG